MVVDNWEERMAVGLIRALKRDFSSVLSLMETSLRQKMTRSLERRELATRRKIF